MTCNSDINKLLKRQSYKCDSAQLVVIIRIDLCMLYCPSIARGPVESHRREKKLTFQMAVTQNLIIVLRRNLAGQLLLLCSLDIFGKVV